MKYFTLLFISIFAHYCYSQTEERYFFSPEEIEGYNKVAKYIQDTSTIESYYSDKKKELKNLTNSKYDYRFAYNKTGLLKWVGIFELDSNRPHTLIYYREIFFNDNERIEQITDYFKKGKNKVSHYCVDDSTLKETQFYTKNTLDGKAQKFYRSGKLKTQIFYTNGKIVSIEEFEETGKKVEATKVEKGNGYWLECNPDGGYCCECYVINGKLKNCQSLNAKKPLRKKS